MSARRLSARVVKSGLEEAVLYSRSLTGISVDARSASGHTDHNTGEVCEMQKAYEKGYFMSQEEEDAAKWQMFEQYKKLRARHAVLTEQVTQALRYLDGFLSQLRNSPERIEMYPLEQFPQREALQAAKT